MRLGMGILAATILVVPFGAAAQTEEPRPAQSDIRGHRAIISLQIENDFLSRWANADRDYTNGFRLGWLSAPVSMPAWFVGLTSLPTIFGGRQPDNVIRRWGFSIGQNLYTPEATNRRELIPNDRPYAAWLYVGFALQYTYMVGDRPVRLDTFELDIGVIGPAAGGRFVQNNFHRLLGADRARGWHNQLHNEPTINLMLERRWRVSSLRGELPPLTLETDIIPSVGIALGNVATYASAGAVLRIGRRLRDDFGPPRPRPSMPGTETFAGSDGFGWYFFVGLEGQAWARNIFLDGNTFRDSHNVDRRPFVVEAQAGVALLLRNMRVSLTQVLRSPEFSERDRWQQFGSISVAFRY